MFKKVIYSILVLSLSLCLIQLPTVVASESISHKPAWIKNFGGAGIDSYASVAVDSNDSIVCVGTSNTASFGNGDWTGIGSGTFRATSAAIVKYNSNGKVINKADFGGLSAGGTGSGTGANEFSSVIAVHDGYIVSGSSIKIFAISINQLTNKP